MTDESLPPTQSGPGSPYIPVGTEIGAYRIEAFVDRGGMASIYEATDLRLNRTVALKVLGHEVSESTDFRERFIRESRFAASLDHPNIVPIYEAGESDGLLYIAMRYVRGSNLAGLLRRRDRWTPSARWPSCLRWPTLWTPLTPPDWSIAMSSRRTFC